MDRHRKSLAKLLAGAVLVSIASIAAGGAHAAPSLRERLALLQAAYPDHIKSIDGNRVVMRGGAKLEIDDGKAKAHPAKLADADVEDMLSQVYPIGACDTGTKPSRNFDPGRIRVTEIFKAMYGTSAGAVRKNMTSIAWFGRSVQVTRVNGADKALAAVRDDLQKLPKPLHKYFRKTAGGFNWRNIAGTKLLSVHSFAAAIDVDIANADYWRWAGGKPGNVPKYRNKIPRQVVAAFERHGFIWGGKWYHYDTMHFEYRPEMIAIGRLAEKMGCK